MPETSLSLIASPVTPAYVIDAVDPHRVVSQVEDRPLCFGIFSQIQVFTYVDGRLILRRGIAFNLDCAGVLPICNRINLKALLIPEVREISLFAGIGSVLKKL